MMNISFLDPIGAACSLLSTYYFTQARARAFPFFLLAISLNSLLYYQKGIYAHLVLEFYYLISGIYGWYSWSASQENARTPVPIIWMPVYFKILFIMIACVSIPLVAYILDHFTDSNIPYWDAVTTVLALLAQWMLCKKWIDCWGIWFVRDALVVVLHWFKNIPFHSLTHVFYLGMAIIGYIKWRKMMAQQLKAGVNISVKLDEKSLWT